MAPEALIGKEQVAHVVGTDIVGYSLLTLQDQLAAVACLRRAVSDALPAGSPAILLDTGDGIFAVFLGGVGQTLNFAQSIARSAAQEGPRLRIGIHSGPVVIQAGLDGKPNAYGPGINLAQRVMAAAEPGQVLLSSVTREFAAAEQGFAAQVGQVRTVRAKHGVSLQVSSMGDQSGAPTGKGSRPLPLVERRFVGRTVELEELHQALIVERRRLLTLVGPGGIGKTSLAIEFASRIRSDFTHDILYVDCSDFRSDVEIEAAVGAELGEVPGSTVVSTLSDQQALVILDCVERAPNAYQFVDRLLGLCPNVQALVTSRTLLGSKWEREIEIGPMLASRTGIEDARTIFCDAASGVSPGFSPKGHEGQLVASIVQALEGVPLSLVLAASRLRYLSLQELLEQVSANPHRALKRRLKGDDRHSDISRVVEDSLALVDAELRETMLQLSVFSGGFFAKDALAVLCDHEDILSELELLRDRSLIFGKVELGRMRFRSLDVVASYIAELALSENLDALRVRHARYFTSKAKEARQLFDSARWRDANAILWSDLGNFRRAIDSAQAAGEQELVHSLAFSLCRMLMEAGLVSDFEALATAAHPEANRELRIELLGLLGGVERRRNNLATAKRLWLERAELLADGNDFERQADAWNDLAAMARLAGDRSEFESFLRRFLDIHMHLSPGDVLCTGLVLAGLFEASGGNPTGAAEHGRRAQAILDAGVRGSRAFFAICNLSALYLQLGELDAAEASCLEHLPDTVSGNHPSYAANLLATLAEASLVRGDVKAAALRAAAFMKIPRSASSHLYDQSGGFRYRVPEDDLAKAVEEFAGLDWKAAALRGASDGHLKG